MPARFGEAVSTPADSRARPEPSSSAKQHVSNTGMDEHTIGCWLSPWPVRDTGPPPYRNSDRLPCLLLSGRCPGCLPV